MDGNGRWATARGRPRVDGHRAGAGAVRRTIEASPGLGISTLTLYAFSTDNWARPQTEVSTLLDLFATYLRSEARRCLEQGVRLRVVGRREGLPASLQSAITRVERLTAAGQTLDLRLCINYSGRDAILDAVRRCGGATREAVSELLGPEVDLLIRTGGEQRLSDFMLWESAYAELVFTPRMWPDFEAADLRAALEEFRGRDRRFGRLPPNRDREGADGSANHTIRSLTVAVPSNTSAAPPPALEPPTPSPAAPSTSPAPRGPAPPQSRSGRGSPYDRTPAAFPPA
jgi:undecaprenyl diphosphate synthase